MSEPQAERAISVDVFRGLTILVMTFVNDLGTAGIPRFMQHALAKEDRMTFVDVVFPAFLFIVGMSMPLARRARMKRGQSNFSAYRHATLRTLGLLLMGYFLVNRWHFDPEVSWLSYNAWTLGAHLCILLLWNDWKTETLNQRRVRWLVLLGGSLGLVCLFVAFAGGDMSHVMKPSWWGILGLIGWAYALSYVVIETTRTQHSLVVGTILALIALRVGVGQESLALPGWVPEVANIGIMASMTLCGVLVSDRFFGHGANDPFHHKVGWTLGFSGMLFTAGYFFRPLMGASKIRATPTWGLYSAGFCCLLFVGVYFLLDVKKWRALGRWAVPAGQNPLLLYLLPGIAFTLFGLSGVTLLEDYFGSGGMRILRAAVLAVAFLGVASLLGRKGVRLRL